MGLAPEATRITVPQVLAKLDGAFASMADAVSAGEFALWVGSGISRRAPDLGMLLGRAVEGLRQRAADQASSAAFTPALEEALGLAGYQPGSLAARYGDPFDTWPEHGDIVNRLWNSYSKVLDVHVPGQPADLVLWELIDVCDAFANPRPPAAQHLCIAILVMEGAVRDVASANWDGFIEAAVDRLAGSASGLLQVVVDPADMRGPAARARLLKFHGSITHATADPGAYRSYLTGSHLQVMEWPEVQKFRPVANALVALASTSRSLVLGLSIQDSNLQTIFIRAQQVHPWQWPCAPAAPAQVFCENAISAGQRTVLRAIYGAQYDAASADIEAASHLQAWAEQTLIALVLRILADKLTRLMAMALEDAGKPAFAAMLAPGLIGLRDQLGVMASVDAVDGSRTPAVEAGIAAWSRLARICREGALPPDRDAYEPVSATPPAMLAGDQNARAAGLGQLGVVLALLESGRSAGRWSLAAPADDDLASGAMMAVPSRGGAAPRPVFIVKSATEAIRLEQAGAFANDNAVVIHGDDTWLRLAVPSARGAKSPPGRTGRVGPSHVSLADLLARSADANELTGLFASEIVL